MKYKLETPAGGSPTFLWIKLFALLSASFPNLLYDKLNLPIQVSPDVQKLAQRFILSDLLLKQNSDYKHALKGVIEELDIDEKEKLAFDKANQTTNLRSKQVILFQQTFSGLERITNAYELYKWGTQTWTYYKYLDQKKYNKIIQLNKLNRLLRGWAVLGSPIQFDIDGINTDEYWTTFRETYEDVYRNSNLNINFPLESHLAIEIKKIIIIQDVAELNILDMLNIRLNNFTSAWDNLVLKSLGIWSWLPLEAEYRTNLIAWRKIINILSETDLQHLEKWVNELDNSLSTLSFGEL